MHSPTELYTFARQLGLKSDRTGREWDKGLGGKFYIGVLLKNTIYQGSVEAGRARQLVEVMWDIVMYEYLRRIGHPAFSANEHPREVVLALWRDGGCVEDGRPHRPHYVTRAMKKRFEGKTRCIPNVPNVPNAPLITPSALHMIWRRATSVHGPWLSTNSSIDHLTLPIRPRNPPPHIQL